MTAGATATINVVASGSGPMTYRWYAGASGDTSAPVGGAAASAYTTPPLQATTNYWARVSNAGASVDSASATITVTLPASGPGTPPRITTQPENETIAPGQFAKLDVGVSGDPPMTFQWFAGPSGTTSSPIAGETTDVYSTPALTQTSQYWVRVQNAAGSDDSETATITVTTTPPPSAGALAILTHPSSHSIASGQTTVLEVSAQGAAPLSYQWFVGASGDLSAPVSGAVGSVLTTGPLTTTSSFWVRVSSPQGSVDSQTATVTISGPSGPPASAPAITAQPQDRSVLVGQTALLSVGAAGTSPLSYQWYIGPSGSTTTPIGGATSPSYTTPGLAATTSYWVRVSNAYGSVDSQTATVTVSAAPPPPSWNAAFEDEVLVLVNQQRAAGAACGGTPYPAVSPLTMNASLRAAARAHSQDMAANGYFSHTSLDGRTFDDRMANAGYGGPFPWGENIAAGYSSPSAVVNGWMTSTGHCTNIMKAGFKVIGVGHAYLSGSPYGNYWTQDFGGG